jgi:hypothetical protein
MDKAQLEQAMADETMHYLGGMTDPHDRQAASNTLLLLVEWLADHGLTMRQAAKAICEAERLGWYTGAADAQAAQPIH